MRQLNDIQMETFHYAPKVQVHKQGRKRVAAYCRVSTLAEEQDLSFETQCDYYEKLIANNSEMELVGIYGDQGFSGLEASHRKEFQRMLEDCDAGKIDLILVKSISRFSRNAVECLETLKKLKEHGITVIFEKENLNSADPQTEMILSIFSSMAQNESCSHSENLRWAMKKRAEMGDPIRQAWYGYRNVKEKGGKRRHWEINEEEARRIRYVFSLAYQAYTPTEIVKKINEFEEAEGTGTVWLFGRINSMLRNEAYRGDILFGKMVKPDYLSKKEVVNKGQAEQYYIEGHHEPIVDPELFDTIQEYLAAGYLDGSNKPTRKKWLKEHPEILLRREQAK